MRGPAAVAVLAALAVGACGGHARAQQDPPASCPRSVAGAQLRVPPGATAGRVPLLLVVIPGGGGDARDGLGLWAPARSAGLALAYPTTTSRFWTLKDEQGTQQVDDVRGLLDRLLGTGCFDRERVSITGVSNGAGFATRVACALPARFAAVVPVSAGFRALDPCRSRASFEAIHGRADTVVPFNGKAPDRKGSVPRFAARWAKRAGCAATPARSHPARRVERVAYRGCAGGVRVGYVALTGTTHSWPGAIRSPFPFRNPSGFRASPEVVRFVSAAPRSA